MTSNYHNPCMHLFLNRATFFTTMLYSVHFPLDLLSSVFIISARRAPRSGLSSCWAILKYYQSINLKTFSEWIRQRARAANYVLPTIATPTNRGGSSKPTSSGTRFRETTLATHSSTQKCIYCSKEHSVMQCSKLRDMSVDERVEWAAKQRRCFSCLGLRHMAYQCRKAQKCGVSGCWRRHHPLLHQDSRSSANEAGEAHEHVETVAHSATSNLQHATRVFFKDCAHRPGGPRRRAFNLCSAR